MSLINEALKKAQRARQEGAATPDAGASGGAVARRPRPRSARSMLLMGVAAVVLVVGSMIGTAIWLTRAPEPSNAPAKSLAAAPVTTAPELAPITTQVSGPPAETPAVSTVAVSLPAPASPAVAAGAVPAAATPAAPAASAPAEAVPAPAKIAPTVAAEPATRPAPAVAEPLPPREPVSDERVHKFVEAVRVMGIRSSGDESKVLMNDRVYRVNDVVDRALGVKLIKVTPDSLTFTDANGAVYVKNF